MKIPKALIIMGRRWKVSICPPWEDNVAGECSLDDQMIRIRNDVPEDLQAETFFHEVLHAAFGSNGMATLANFTEEQLVSFLAPVLTDTLTRNKLLRER